MTDSNNKPIGGFFELELTSGNSVFHPDALALTNGRACLSLILETVQPSHVYLPFYLCEAVFESLTAFNIEYSYYKIDENLNPIQLPEPQEGELLVFVNYFGLKNNESLNVAEKFGNRVVIDDTHRFFNDGYRGAYSFTSARKYFGVPDGAYLYGVDKNVDDIPRNTDISVSHSVMRLLGQQDESYQEYSKYEKTLGCEIKRISTLSEILLSNIDYKKVAAKRKHNFNFVHKALKNHNMLEIDTTYLDVPFCYPFLPSIAINRRLFHAENYYIPTLWPDVIERFKSGYELEKDITMRLLPLPIDHRYTTKDMENILSFIGTFYK